MKKLIAILLVLTLLSTLCACGRKQTAPVEEAGQKPAEDTGEAAAPQQTQASEPDVQEADTASATEELLSLTPDVLLGDWVCLDATIDGAPVSGDTGFFSSLGITQDVTANFSWTNGEEFFEDNGLNIEFLEGQLLEDCPMFWHVELLNSTNGCTYKLTLTGHDTLTLVQDRPVNDDQSIQKIIVNFARVEV